MKIILRFTIIPDIHMYNVDSILIYALWASRGHYTMRIGRDVKFDFSSFKLPTKKGISIIKGLTIGK